MVDTLALGASAVRRGGSSPLSRTKSKIDRPTVYLFYFWPAGEDLNPWVEGASGARVFAIQIGHAY